MLIPYVFREETRRERLGHTIIFPSEKAFKLIQIISKYECKRTLEPLNRYHIGDSDLFLGVNFPVKEYVFMFSEKDYYFVASKNRQFFDIGPNYIIINSEELHAELEEYIIAEIIPYHESVK